MRVAEAIWHGDYRSSREVDIERSLDGVRHLLASSPYPQKIVSDDTLLGILADLIHREQASHGWADYRVVHPL